MAGCLWGGPAVMVRWKGPGGRGGGVVWARGAASEVGGRPGAGAPSRRGAAAGVSTGCWRPWQCRCGRVRPSLSEGRIQAVEQAEQRGPVALRRRSVVALEQSRRLLDDLFRWNAQLQAAGQRADLSLAGALEVIDQLE